MSDDPITDRTPCASRPKSRQADALLPMAGITPEQEDAIIAAVGRIAHASPGAPETSTPALEPRPNRDWAEEKTLADFRRVFADERKWKSLGFGRTEG